MHNIAAVNKNHTHWTNKLEAELSITVELLWLKWTALFISAVLGMVLCNIVQLATEWLVYGALAMFIAHFVFGRIVVEVWLLRFDKRFKKIVG